MQAHPTIDILYMKQNILITYGLLIAFTFMFGLSSCYYDNEAELYSTGSCTDIEYSYVTRIKAIVDQNCARSGCHAGPSPEAGIGLENYADVKNSAINTNFFCSINWNSGCSQMPKNSSKLDKCSIIALEQWRMLAYPEN